MNTCRMVGHTCYIHGISSLLTPWLLSSPLPSWRRRTATKFLKKKVERNHQLFNFMTTRFLGTRCYKSMLTSLMCNSGENVCKELGRVGGWGEGDAGVIDVCVC